MLGAKIARFKVPKTGYRHRKWHKATKWASEAPGFLGTIKQWCKPKTEELGDGWAVPSRGTRPDGRKSGTGLRNGKNGLRPRKVAHGHREMVYKTTPFPQERKQRKPSLVRKPRQGTEESSEVRRQGARPRL